MTDSTELLGQLPSHMLGQGYEAPGALHEHRGYGNMSLGGFMNPTESGMIGQLPLGMADFGSAPVMAGGAMIGQASTSGQFTSGFGGLIGQAAMGSRPPEVPPAANAGPSYSMMSEHPAHAPIGQTDLSDWRRRQSLIQQSSLFSVATPLPNGGMGGATNLPPPRDQTPGARPMYSSIGNPMTHKLPPVAAPFKGYMPQPSLSWSVSSQIGQLHHPEIGLSLQGDYSSMGRPPDIGSIDSDMQSLTISTRRTGSSLGTKPQLTAGSNVGTVPSGRDSPQREDPENLDQALALDSPNGGRSYSLDSAGISNYSDVSERRDVFPCRSSSLTQQFDRNALFQGPGQGMVGELIDRRRSSMDVHDATPFTPELFITSRRACGESTFGLSASAMARASLDTRRVSMDITGGDRMLVGVLESPGPSSRAGSGVARVPPSVARPSLDMGPGLYTTAGPVVGASQQRAVGMQQQLQHGPQQNQGGAPFKVLPFSRSPEGSLLLFSWFLEGPQLLFSWSPEGSQLLFSWFLEAPLLLFSWSPEGSLLLSSWSPEGSLLLFYGSCEGRNSARVGILGVSSALEYGTPHVWSLPGAPASAFRGLLHTPIFPSW